MSWTEGDPDPPEWWPLAAIVAFMVIVILSALGGWGKL